MNNNVEKFLSEVFGEVRAFEKEGIIWFIAKDICTILEIKNVSLAVNGNKTRGDKGISDKHKGIWEVNTPGGVQSLLCVDDFGLHNLISKGRYLSVSKKAELYNLLTKKDFSEFITSDNSETCFLEKLEESLLAMNIKGVRQYVVLNNKYRIDYYIQKLNIAVEYDEGNHKYYTQEQQEVRQKEIEKELGCKFIRVNNKHSDEYNIGYVIKEIFNIRF